MALVQANLFMKAASSSVMAFLQLKKSPQILSVIGNESKT
jgi:hypothetical protein